MAKKKAAGKVSDAVKRVVAGEDSDKVYDELCPVSPGQYALVREKDQTFQEAFPDYMNRGEFRNLVEQAAGAKATPEPAPEPEQPVEPAAD